MIKKEMAHSISNEFEATNSKRIECFITEKIKERAESGYKDYTFTLNWDFTAPEFVIAKKLLKESDLDVRILPFKIEVSWS